MEKLKFDLTNCYCIVMFLPNTADIDQQNALIHVCIEQLHV